MNKKSKEPWLNNLNQWEDDYIYKVKDNNGS